ncbi:MAG: hypothetical protein JXA07_10290 [Spirochaetes bacterium]|nr:hypothetical protein [Spirochaetota bacterium]
MKEAGKMNSAKKAARITVLVLVLAASLGITVTQTLNSTFDQDEFQHIHLVWHMINGKVLYSDFFDHHGPVNTYLNSILFRACRLSPGIQTLLFFRFLSLGYLLGILVCIYFFAASFFRSRFYGLCTAVLLSLLVFFQDKATEIRPDVLQNLLFVTGILLLFSNLQKWRIWKGLAAGTCMGFMLLCNTKAAIGIAAVIIYFILEYFLAGRDLKRLARQILVILLPVLAVFILFVLLFLFNGSLREFLFYVFVYPFIIVSEDRPDLPVQYLKFFIRYQGPFLLAVLSGFFYLFRDMAGQKKDTDRIRRLLFPAVLSAVAVSTSVLPLYSQHYLSFLPLLACVGIYGIKRMTETVCVKFRSSVLCTVTGNSVLPAVFLFMTLVSLHLMFLKGPAWKQIEQLSLTRYVLEEVPREEKILTVFTLAGGYMFNEDLQYYWAAMINAEEVFSRIEGREVFGRNLIDLMEKEHLQYIIADEYEFLQAWPDGFLYSYILEHYIPHDQYPALWTRISGE